MRAYYSIPETYRKMALRMFSFEVARMIFSEPDLHLLPAQEGASQSNIDDEEMAVRTIFPFFISCGRELLSVEDCGRIYRALNCDVSWLLPRSATVRERKVAAQCCHIGQPIAAPAPAGEIRGTLRISAGARVVSDTWCALGLAASLQKLDEQFGQIRTILEKIRTLVKNLDSLESMCETHGITPFHDGYFRRVPFDFGAAADSDIHGSAAANAASALLKPRRLQAADDRI
jgi:hypothetical protein